MVEALPYSETVTVLSDITAMPRVALYYETVGWIVKAGFQSEQLVEEHQVLIQQDISEEKALLSAAESSLELAISIYERNKVSL